MDTDPRREKKDGPEFDYDPDIDYTIDKAASATDMTGAIPMMLQDEGSAAAYAALYGVWSKPKDADEEKERE